MVSRLTLPDANLQTACTELLKNVADTRGERYSSVYWYTFAVRCCGNRCTHMSSAFVYVFRDCSSWIQPLHVVKEFSSSSHARRCAQAYMYEETLLVLLHYCVFCGIVSRCITLECYQAPPHYTHSLPMYMFIGQLTKCWVCSKWSNHSIPVSGAPKMSVAGCWTKRWLLLVLCFMNTKV